MDFAHLPQTRSEVIAPVAEEDLVHHVSARGQVRVGRPHLVDGQTIFGLTVHEVDVVTALTKVDNVRVVPLPTTPLGQNVVPLAEALSDDGWWWWNGVVVGGWGGGGVGARGLGGVVGARGLGGVIGSRGLGGVVGCRGLGGVVVVGRGGVVVGWGGACWLVGR